MKYSISLIFLIFCSLLYAQVYKDRDSIKELLPELQFPSETQFVKLEVYETDSLTASVLCELGGESNHYYSLYYSVQEFEFFMDWYVIDSVTLMNTYAYQLLQQIEKINFDLPIHDIVKHEMSIHESGIKKLKFNANHSGTYTDKWFNRKNEVFTLEFMNIEQIGMGFPKTDVSGGYENILLLKKVKSAKNSTMLVFTSKPTGGPVEIILSRTIYFDIQEFKMRSFEIRSPIQFTING